MSWWGWTLIGVGLLIASWMLLVLLAARLPDGSLKELAGFLPDCAITARRLRGDPRVPRRAKLAIGVALLWVLSPIDLIPEFLPVIGPLDDVVVVALAFRYAARQVPRSVLLEAWPGKPSTIERVLGPARSKPAPTVDDAGGERTSPTVAGVGAWGQLVSPGEARWTRLPLVLDVVCRISVLALVGFAAGAATQSSENEGWILGGLYALWQGVVLVVEWRVLRRGPQRREVVQRQLVLAGLVASPRLVFAGIVLALAVAETSWLIVAASLVVLIATLAVVVSPGVSWLQLRPSGWRAGTSPAATNR